LVMLFTPFTLRDVTLRNRIVVAPMLQGMAEGGHATPWHHVHIGRFAIGGVGMVIMESTKVEKRGRGTPGDLGLWDDAHAASLRPIVDFAHEHGSAIGIQLGHTGRKAKIFTDADGRTNEDDIVGPSAIAHSDARPVPRALELFEMPGVIESFAAAARRADLAGFDMVEIHGAHGYLLHSFLSPVANQRTDIYGGSDENRERLMLEVSAAVRAAFPAHKPVCMRLSCEDMAGVGLDIIVPLSAKLKALGIDIIDCSSGGMRDDMRDIPGVNADEYGYQAHYAEVIRRDAGIPTIAVGHIIHPAQAEELLQHGKADLIAIGREMLYNPNWAIDAAQKLGADPDFELLPSNLRGVLASRKKRFRGQLSTSNAPWPHSS